MSDATDRTHPPKTDARPDAIGRVWGISLAMLGICIPLCVLLKSAALPIIVIGAAALVSMLIWQSESRKNAAADKDAEALRARIQELEERLANVEVINSFEERLAERTLARAEAQAAQPEAGRVGSRPAGQTT